MRKKLCAVLLIVSLLLTFTATPFAYAQADENSTRITSLTTNFRENPIGIEPENIRFGWKMESNRVGEAQKDYQISLKKGSSAGEEVWNSGKVDSPLSSAVAYTGPQLELETRYYWTVFVTEASGQQISETAYFETGCDWDGASWITIEDYDNGMNSLLFRTEQRLNGNEVASARLYITGLGSYEAYVNGREVQGDVNSILTPGWTDYSSYVHYQTYDVTEYLNDGGGTVTLGAVVGTGWYGSSIVAPEAIGYDTAIGEAKLLERCLYAKMVITYADNTSQVIVTDPDNWKVSSRTPYEKDGIYEGEAYNASTAAELDGWSETGYNTSGWAAPQELTYKGTVSASSDGVIYDYRELPMTSAYSYNAAADIITAEAGSPYAQGELDPSKIITYRPGDEIHLKAGDTLIADFGQNAAASVELSVSAPSGTSISMQSGECLSDGRDGSFPKGFLIPGACEGRGFQYIASGNGVESYRAQFHFTGYQFLEITADQDVTFYNLSSMAVSSLREETGFVETSSGLLNQFISNSKWSQVSNFNSVPTDCPQREYYGWSGDAQLFAESAMYHFDSAGMLGNYIEIMNDYAKTYGNYGNIMPMHTNSFFSKMIGAGWADAGILIPWVYYQQTGDLSPARTYWDEMTKYTDRVYANGHTFSLGDWCGIGESSGTPFTAYAYNVLIQNLMANMAKALGYEEDAARYEQNAEAKRQETIQKYVTEEGDVLCASVDGGGEGFVDNAQTALAWAVKLKLYNTEQQRQKIAGNLAASVQNENQSVSANRGENTLASGFLGVNVLLPALSESGNSETAFDLMLNTDLYTFLYSVANGATSIWERWDIWQEETGYDVSNVSQNHYSYGAASEWLYENLLGIQKDDETPGFQHFILQPEVNDTLSYAKGSYNSYYGTIESGWQTADARTVYDFSVPANTTATLYLAADAQSVSGFKNIDGVTFEGITSHNSRQTAQFSLQSGSYTFTEADGKLTVSLQDGFTADPAADKAILRSVLAYAEAAFTSDEFDSVIESVQGTFAAVLQNARAVDASLRAGQAEVDRAWQALMTEIHKLGFVRGDKTSLGELIDLAGTFDSQIDRYTPATAEPFQTALAKADAVYGDGDAMQGDVGAAESALLEAMLNLRYKADKGVLESVLAKASGIDVSAYDTQSVAVFNAAHEQAKAVNADADAAQFEVDGAAARLETAIEGLAAAGAAAAATGDEAAVKGDSRLTAGTGNARTGDTAGIAAALAVLAFAGAGLLRNKKKK